MRISEISIERPVFATVLSLVIVLVGAISFDRLTVRQFPKIDRPIVSVETVYPGASSDIVERQVTEPIEDALAGLEGVDFVTSTSWPERSNVVFTFKVERDIEDAAADVRDKLGGIRDFLPDDVDEPAVYKQDSDAYPTIWIGFSSTRHKRIELTHIIDQLIVDRIKTISGVADVVIHGGRRYAMRVWLDRGRMAAYGVTTHDVESALRAQNLEVPAGRIESAQREFTVLTETDLETPDEFKKIILREENGYLVRLDDVARVEIGSEEARTATRANGVGGVGIGVVKQSVANPLEVNNAVREELERMRPGFPDGMDFDVAYDPSVFIDRSIDAVYWTIGEAIILVTLVIFAFLNSFRATIIPLVAIPISLIGALGIMYAFGLSLNLLTMLAMVMAIGLVVDDAIVMLENIQRHVERGEKPVEAALKGSREIGYAVLVMTLTLVAVFAPVSFATGRTGRLFSEFALTLGGAVLVSGFVALTLTPLMCWRVFKTSTGPRSKLAGVVPAALDRLTDLYRGFVTRALARRWMAGVATAVVAALGYLMFVLLPQMLDPYEDQGLIINVVRGPEGATLDYMIDNTAEVEDVFAAVPEVHNYFSGVGQQSVNQAMMFVTMESWEDRDRSTREIAGEVGPKMMQVPGVFGIATLPTGLGGDFGSRPVNIKIMTTESYAELDAIVQQILTEARKNTGLIALESDLILNKPELSVDLNRSKVADAGTDVKTVSETLATMLGGRDVTRFKYDGEEYDVIVQVADSDRRDPEDMNLIFVRGAGGQMLPLSSFVTVSETVTPRYLAHFDKLRVATINAELAPDYALGDALDYMEGLAKEVGGERVRVDFGGTSREFKESGSSMVVTFLLALVFIYLVLAAQFESFIEPLVIMLTVPLAITGALVALKLIGGSVNLYTQIGLITLVGLITKHGILIVEFANQLQDAGTEKFEAIVESASMRLRPILMTTAAMVLGALPLALASGPGAESRQEIGAVIIGGLIFGTVLTLFVIPAAYSVLPRRGGSGSVIEASSVVEPA